MKFMSWPTEKWRRFWRCCFKTSMVILLTSGLLSFGSLGATARAATVEDGTTLFEQSCAGCHSIDGSGTSYGPDLQAATQRRDRDWLVRWIAAPEEVIESGDAIAAELVEQYGGVPMPNMGLSPDEVESIVLYMEHAAAKAAAPEKEDGKTLFEQSCAGCHSIDGSGTSYGPDLQGATQRRDRDWLVRWIAAPEEVIESGDAIAAELVEQYGGVPMPNMGLSPEQVEAIVLYMENAAAKAAAPEKEETAAPLETAEKVKENVEESKPVGDAAIGQKLFAGTIPFENGGPACMSCHTVDVVGALKGGTLGPNLTHIVDRYTVAGLKSVLPTLPYPTMQGIYENKLLTETEQAYLLSFFKEANRSPSPKSGESNESSQTESFHLSSTWTFVLLGVGGFILLALLSQITWSDRLTGVRQRLVTGQK